MRKFIYALIAIAMSMINVAIMAQSSPFSTGYLIPVAKGDTISGVSTVTKSFTATAGYNTVAVQVNLDTIKGSPHDTISGKVYLQKSIDGVYYTVTDSTTISSKSVIGGATGFNAAYYSHAVADGSKYQLIVKSTTAFKKCNWLVRVYYLERKTITSSGF